MILRKHRDALLTIIQESGLDPTLFTARNGTISNRQFFIIELRNTPIHFAVRSSDEFDSFQYCSSRFSPNFPLGNLNISLTPQILYDKFNEWLNSVAKPYLDDVITPDLWQILEDTRSGAIRELETPDYSESFSEEEKIQLRLSIDEFRLLIVGNFNPHKEELDAIDNRLKYLSDAIDKHNKFDWKGIAISTLISIGITLALNPKQGNQLLQLFKQVFSNILYLLP